MPMRTAHARWEGSGKIGKGEIDFRNGLFRSDYSFGSRLRRTFGPRGEIAPLASTSAHVHHVAYL